MSYLPTSWPPAKRFFNFSETLHAEYPWWVNIFVFVVCRETNLLWVYGVPTRPRSADLPCGEAKVEGGRVATSLCFGFAAGQVGTPCAGRHSVNPQQICFAEIRKYKNINSSWLVGVQSFSEIGDKKILTSVQFTFTSLQFSSLTINLASVVHVLRTA